MTRMYVLPAAPGTNLLHFDGDTLHRIAVIGWRVVTSADDPDRMVTTPIMAGERLSPIAAPEADTAIEHPSGLVSEMFGFDFHNAGAWLQAKAKAGP